jgi:hypothetical protein
MQHNFHKNMNKVINLTPETPEFGMGIQDSQIQSRQARRRNLKEKFLTVKCFNFIKPRALRNSINLMGNKPTVRQGEFDQERYWLEEE